MDTLQAAAQLEILHGSYHIDGKDNLSLIPAEKAVFGVFAVVDDQPVNCRYVAQAVNLRETVRALAEQPPGTGMQKFMQGPWVKMLRYCLLPDATEAERQRVAADWSQQYAPSIDDEGEYPGYYA
jgi:hypothetical protein